MEIDKPESNDISINSLASDEDMFASSQSSGILPTSQIAVQVTTECLKEENIPSSSTSKLDSLSKEPDWRGTPLSKLSRNTGKEQYPPVVSGPQHTVLFKLPLRKGEVPKPWPEQPVDVWDQNHVRMPHSASSLYPVTPTELRPRWQLVQEALRSTVTTSQQLEAAILHYNSKYSDRWDFQALHSFFSEALEEMETQYFFANVLPKVVDLALSLPKLVTGGIPLLRKNVTHSISLSQQQISCLLANAFLSTFPRRNTSRKNSEYSGFPCINFNRLFNGDGAQAKGRTASVHEKLKCLINYFRRVTNKVPDGVVTYSRHYVPADKLPEWSKETARLPKMYVSSSGTIEDEGTGMLEMDFANRFVGGSVLGRGCVQEEIRFVIYPELTLALLFTEVLDDTEALIVNGCERFNIYRGYANSFEWAGDAEDTTPRDAFGRRYCTVVAVDALRFPNSRTQYSAPNISRELNKAYVGFSWGASRDCKESVATGNWGCGAFRGDACLKTLLQLMAAACTGRDLAYFTFGDDELCHKLANMHSFLVCHQVTVGDLWKLLTSYSPTLYRHSLYDHIHQAVTTGSIPTPLSPFTKGSKKPRVQESSKDNVARKEKALNNGHKLSTEDIGEALLRLEEDVEDDSEDVKPIEAKTLSVQKDKELCLKRLSSSWTNLNESKRDFGPSGLASTDQSSGAVPSTMDTIRHNEGTGSVTNRKKKISDYFQSVSKS